jgi:hypothetical protein
MKDDEHTTYGRATRVGLALAALLLLIMVGARPASSEEPPAQPPPQTTAVADLSGLLTDPTLSRYTETRDEGPPRYRTAPADLPQFSVRRGPGTPAPGYLFVSVYDLLEFGAYTGYRLILDNNGEPLYYASTPGFPATFDFKVQENGRLTHALPHPVRGAHIVQDEHYQTIATIRAANGRVADPHDFQLGPNGRALLLIYDRQIVDLSAIAPGQRRDATVIGCIVQEQNAAGEVIFEWHSWDHVSILETILSLDTEPLPYIHCNSVDYDLDGNILISNRNLNNVMKIDRATGDVLWRLGGKLNDFTMDKAGRFSVQHDARRLPNGHLTLYDNGMWVAPAYSRGMEYALDEVALTAVKVAEFRRDPDVASWAMGSMQRLENGGALIGWGRSFGPDPLLTEFDAAGEMVLEMSLRSPLVSYRAQRAPWTGLPLWPPAIALQQNGTAVRLYFSWNGATEIDRYTIFGGPVGGATQFLGTAPRSGFETTFDTAVPLDQTWSFYVVPVDGAGKAGLPSPTISARMGSRAALLPLVAAGS